MLRSYKTFSFENVVGISLAIVILVGRANTGMIVALHRFVEVSIGIAVGLAISAVWPEKRGRSTSNVESTLARHP